MTNKERITQNNADLREAIAQAEALPDAGSGGDIYAFLDDSLTVISSSKTWINPYACYGMEKIQTVNLPEAVQIDAYAFYGCTGITSFHAPKVKTIRPYGLYNCEKLTNINLPLIVVIYESCFYKCTALTKADFELARAIIKNSFAYCEALEALILRRTTDIAVLNNINAFEGTPIADGTGYIYVPKTLDDGSDGVAAYQAATNWSTYSAQFRAIEDYPDITGG